MVGILDELNKIQGEGATPNTNVTAQAPVVPTGIQTTAVPEPTEKQKQNQNDLNVTGMKKKNVKDMGELLTLTQRQVQTLQVNAKVTQQVKGQKKITDFILSIPPDKRRTREGLNTIVAAFPHLAKDPQAAIVLAEKQGAVIREAGLTPSNIPISDSLQAAANQVGVDPNDYTNPFLNAAVGVLKALNEGAIATGRARKGQQFNIFGGAAALADTREAKEEQARVSSVEERKLGLEERKVNLQEVKALSDAVKAEREAGKKDFAGLKNQNDIESSTFKLFASATSESAVVFRFLSQISGLVGNKPGSDSVFADPKSKFTLDPNDTKKFVVPKIFDRETGEQIGQSGGQQIDHKGIRDVALVYSFIKILDPESVVREGEIRLSQSALSLLDRAGIKLEQLANGALLSDPARKEILNIAREQTRSLAPSFVGSYMRANENIINKGLNRKSVLNRQDDNSFVNLTIQNPGILQFDSQEEAESLNLPSGAIFQLPDGNFGVVK